MSPELLKFLGYVLAVIAFIGSAFVEGLAHDSLLAVAATLVGGVALRRPGDTRLGPTDGGDDSVSDPAKIITSIGAVVSALTVRVERDDAGKTERVTVLGIPVWDREWRGVKRRQARREARRRDAR